MGLAAILKNEDGLETIEVVIIAAVLVGIALLFRKQIFGIFENLMGQVTDAVTGQDLTAPPA